MRSFIGNFKPSAFQIIIIIIILIIIIIISILIIIIIIIILSWVTNYSLILALTFSVNL